MSINRQRLLELLKGSGFILTWSGGQKGGSVYDRRSTLDELYESISYHFAGKEREAVVAHARVSVWWGYPTISEERHIPDVATVPDRGYAVITSDADASAWEHRLAEVGPVRAAEVARDLGPGLLERTKGARAAVMGYLATVEAHGAWAVLEHMVSAAERAAAERFLDFPIMSGPEAEPLYRSAALAIVKFHRAVEKDDAVLRDMNPLENSELGSRIQLLVNRLSRNTHAAAELTNP